MTTTSCGAWKLIKAFAGVFHPCVDVKMWRWYICVDVKMYNKPPLLEEPFAQTPLGNIEKLNKTRFLSFLFWGVHHRFFFYIFLNQFWISFYFRFFPVRFVDEKTNWKRKWKMKTKLKIKLKKHKLKTKPIRKLKTKLKIELKKINNWKINKSRFPISGKQTIS